MNYHFTTTKAHFELGGGKVLEIYTDEAMKTESDHPFKGNMDLEKLQAVIKQVRREKISFVRMEATTNLIGGQPFSMANLKEVRRIAAAHGIPVIIDCSLISENAYFIKRREPAYADASIESIVREMMRQADMIYLSGRKSTCVRGGLIATNNPEYFEQLKAWLPLYEGFITYGGMSSKEIEAMAVGIREMVDIDVASSSADLIAYFVQNMVKRGIPAVTPPGGLAGHVDATRFLPHIPQAQYIAGALNAAVYIVSGVRGMERGTVSMDRDAQGNDVFSDMELCRLAVPRRVYTVSHIDYVVDRLDWLLQAPGAGGRPEVHPRAARAAVLHRQARGAGRLGQTAGGCVRSGLRAGQLTARGGTRRPCCARCPSAHPAHPTSPHAGPVRRGPGRCLHPRFR